MKRLGFGFSAGLLLSFCCLNAPAAAVTGWAPETGFGNDATLQVNNPATAGPTLLSTDANPGSTIRNTSFWAAMPSAVTLADGDKITLSGSVTFTGTNGTVLGSGLNNQLRWGLFIDADADPDFTDWLGYAPNSGNSSTAGAFNRRAAPGGATIFTSMGSLAGGTRTAAGILTGGVQYNFNFEITRSGSALSFNAFLRNSDLTFNDVFTGVSDASPVTLTYDHVAFLVGNNFNSTASATFQKIDVTYTPVPEPSLAALGTLIGFSFLSVRRRARKQP